MKVQILFQHLNSFIRTANTLLFIQLVFLKFLFDRNSTPLNLLKWEHVSVRMLIIMCLIQQRSKDRRVLCWRNKCSANDRLVDALIITTEDVELKIELHWL